MSRYEITLVVETEGNPRKWNWAEMFNDGSGDTVVSVETKPVEEEEQS